MGDVVYLLFRFQKDFHPLQQSGNNQRRQKFLPVYKQEGSRAALPPKRSRKFVSFAGVLELQIRRYAARNSRQI